MNKIEDTNKMKQDISKLYAINVVGQLGFFIPGQASAGADTRNTSMEDDMAAADCTPAYQLSVRAVTRFG